MIQWWPIADWYFLFFLYIVSYILFSYIVSVISGCSITEIDSTKYEFSIDGEQADLGKFSEAIYKKICRDAKQQQFQGFRPGTIPPHLEPTYRMFSMDECARETTLEAMEQNNIRPFENARSEFEFEQIMIPPVVKKGKKKGGRKKKVALAENEANSDEPKPEWRLFGTMKEACDAGWKPGQPFRFVVKNCNGQKVLEGSTIVDPNGLKQSNTDTVNAVLQNQSIGADYSD